MIVAVKMRYHAQDNISKIGENEKAFKSNDLKASNLFVIPLGLEPTLPHFTTKINVHLQVFGNHSSIYTDLI